MTFCRSTRKHFLNKHLSGTIQMLFKCLSPKLFSQGTYQTASHKNQPKRFSLSEPKTINSARGTFGNLKALPTVPSPLQQVKNLKKKKDQGLDQSINNSLNKQFSNAGSCSALPYKFLKHLSEQKQKLNPQNRAGCAGN